MEIRLARAGPRLVGARPSRRATSLELAPWSPSTASAGYWQSGTEQAARDVFPKVLWLVPDEARAGVLAQVIARQPAEARSLFVVWRAGDVVARLRQGAA